MNPLKNSLKLLQQHKAQPDLMHISSDIFMGKFLLDILINKLLWYHTHNVMEGWLSMPYDQEVV